MFQSHILKTVLKVIAISAVTTFCIIFSATIGNDEAKACMGCVLQNYTSVSKISKAAENGEVFAMVMLGDIYSKGHFKGWYVPQDKGKALKWYRKAAKEHIGTKGQTVADAQFKLAEMYWKGDGVKQDTAEALEWYRRAAEEGVFLGRGNLEGRYPPELHHADAQFMLCKCYWYGHVVEQDLEESRKWFNEIIRNYSEYGDQFPEYKFVLGKCFYYGIFVDQNKTEARRLWREVAEARDDDFCDDTAEAQFLLGELYYKGDGVKKNINEAKKWYGLAAKKWHVGAKTRLKELSK